MNILCISFNSAAAQIVMNIQNKKMKLIVICWVLCLVYCDSKAENQLKRCVKDGKTIRFICVDYSCDNGFNASVEQPKYKCESKGQSFELNKNLLKGYPKAEKFNISSLGINHLNVNGTFSSDTIAHLNVSANQLSNIPSSISMPNLRELDLHENQFSSLTSGNFKYAFNDDI